MQHNCTGTRILHFFDIVDVFREGLRCGGNQGRSQLQTHILSSYIYSFLLVNCQVGIAHLSLPN